MGYVLLLISCTDCQAFFHILVRRDIQLYFRVPHCCVKPVSRPETPLTANSSWWGGDKMQCYFKFVIFESTPVWNIISKWCSPSAHFFLGKDVCITYCVSIIWAAENIFIFKKNIHLFHRRLCTCLCIEVGFFH